MSFPETNVGRYVAPALASLVVLLAVAPIALRAHTDHGKPMHGGLVAEAGLFQAEFVDGGGMLTLHISHHGQPLATQGGRATVTARAEDGKAISIRLFPSGTRFVAQGTLAGTGAKSATAVIALPGMPERTLQFPLE